MSSDAVYVTNRHNYKVLPDEPCIRINIRGFPEDGFFELLFPWGKQLIPTDAPGQLVDDPCQGKWKLIASSHLSFPLDYEYIFVFEYQPYVPNPVFVEWESYRKGYREGYEQGKKDAANLVYDRTKRTATEVNQIQEQTRLEFYAGITEVEKALRHYLTEQRTLRNEYRKTESDYGNGFYNGSHWALEQALWHINRTFHPQTKP